MAVILWNKKYTETLADTLIRFQETLPEYKDERVTYAGRLDPLAEGLLILLTGEDVYRKDHFLGLEKTYQVSFVFGVNTDSYDILGLLQATTDKEVSFSDFEKELAQLKNIKTQQYPPYSSKTVQGKPLYQWSKESRLSEITIPSRNVLIFSTSFLERERWGQSDIDSYIKSTVASVKGDFRQKEILSVWDNYFLQSKRDFYTIYSIEAHVSSGTYVRTLVNHLGEVLGVGACSLKITRTSVGDYKLDPSLDFKVLSV